MDRYLLKNIIIIILALANVFLLGTLALRRTAAVSAREQTETQLVSLFAADGMELDRSLISWQTPPDPLTLTRDPAREREAAVLLLGEDAALSSDDGITSSYTAARGAARFRSNGGFDAAGSLSGQGDGQSLCREFCKRFSYSEPEFTLDDQGTGSGTAVLLQGKFPVYNAAVTFTLDRGALMTVSGVLLQSEGTASPADQTLLSGAAALTAFQQLRRESYAVVSAVTDLFLCYELQSTAASTRSLTPSWCVVTDSGKYYVNCISGAAVSG